MTQNPLHLPVPVDLWCISVYLFWPDEPLVFIAGVKAQCGVNPGQGYEDKMLKLTWHSCPHLAGEGFSCLLNWPPIKKRLRTELECESESLILKHTPPLFLENENFHLTRCQCLGVLGGSRVAGRHGCVAAGKCWVFLFVSTYSSTGLQEHLSPQGVSRAKMNEPPVDSLPPWQMAQDRGGHRGLGGGVCVCVCLHVSEREGEREREGFCCSEGKSGIPISLMTKVNWDIPEKSETPYAAWISTHSFNKDLFI